MAAPRDEPSRPKGIGLTAAILCALAVITFVAGLFPPEVSGRTLAGFFHPDRLPSLVSSSALFTAALFTIWNYWKSAEWARVLILISSFLIAADEISTIVEHDGNLVVVMSHPILFFRLAIAIFLLYWLNTGPLRAWFKKVPFTAADLIGQHLSGKLCIAIQRSAAGPDQGWHLAFEHDAELILDCPWRIVMDDNLAFSSNFEGNPSGNYEPENPADEELPRQLLQNLRVTRVRVTPRTSDLFITFEMGLELQTWSADSRSEQWRYFDPLLTVVADAVGLASHAIHAATSAKNSAAND